MDTLTARVEDGLLQQRQHIGIGAEHHLLTTGEALGFVLQAQRGEGRRVNFTGDGPAQARRPNQMMRPRMTSPRMKPPMIMACVMSGNVGSVVLAGGSKFPIKAAADEALGVEVAVMMTSSAAGVAVGVMDGRCCG